MDVRCITKAWSLQYSFQCREQVNIGWSQVRESCSVVTLFFAKKSLTETDRCAGALLWRRNQLLVFRFRDISFLPRPWVDEGCRCPFLYTELLHYSHYSSEFPWIYQRYTGMFWSYCVCKRIGKRKKGAGRRTEKMTLIGAFSECANVPKGDSYFL